MGKLTSLKRLALMASLGMSVGVLLPLAAQAATPGNFALQVTPSPLVTTVKPGQPTSIDLKIRNASTGSEELKIEPRAFALNNSNGQVSLLDTTPPDISQWISFSAPSFTVQPGEWFTEKVRVALPKDTGFSYSFALIISRQENPKPTEGGRLIKGSLAVFTLVNVDRPGATRKLEVPKFVTTRGLYEYLPATFKVQFKNTGNTIVQPYGNVFVERSSKDTTPITTLPVNETRGYILPGSNRTLEANWDKGFPAYKTIAQADGNQKQSLIWDSNQAKLSNIRIGRYTAKLVAVYNDGQRDVPIEQEVSFWVIPWRLILGFMALVAALGFLGRFRNKRRTEKAVKRALEAAKKEPKPHED